jgi:hypothetical protein
MLCETCHTIFRGSFQDDWVDHHATLQNLWESVVEGCRICITLWHRVFNYQAYVSEDVTNIYQAARRVATKRIIREAPDDSGRKQMHLSFKTVGFPTVFSLQILNNTTGMLVTVNSLKNRAEINLRARQFHTSTHNIQR